MFFLFTSSSRNNICTSYGACLQYAFLIQYYIYLYNICILSSDADEFYVWSTLYLYYPILYNYDPLHNIASYVFKTFTVGKIYCFQVFQVLATSYIVINIGSFVYLHMYIAIYAAQQFKYNCICLI